jgi:hypothetical protein
MDHLVLGLIVNRRSDLADLAVAFPDQFRCIGLRVLIPLWPRTQLMAGIEAVDQGGDLGLIGGALHVRA